MTAVLTSGPVGKDPVADGPAIRVQSLGHVVLKVQALDRSETFYSKVLGLPVVSRISDPVQMMFFSLGNHHDFAIIAVGEGAPAPDPAATGLGHVAFKVGDSGEELTSARRALVAAGVPVLYEVDRAFTKSVHVVDPDGHEVEVYVDISDAWKADPAYLGIRRA